MGYKTQVEMALRDRLSAPWMNMATKMQRSAETIQRKVGGAFSRMRQRVSGAIGGMISSIRGLLPIIGMAGLVLTLRSATKEAAKFSEQVAKVSTMLSGPGLRFLGQYQSMLEKMSVQFGRSTRDLSDGLYDILSAAVPPSQALKMLDVVVKGAVGGFTELSNVTKGVSALLKGYSMDASQAMRATDILSQIVEGGIVTMGQIAPIIGTITTISANAGVSIDELGAAISTLTGVAIPVPTVITGIRAAITSLTSPSAEAADTMKILRDAMAEEGFTGFIRALKAAKLSSEEMSELFPNIRAKVAIETLVAQSERFAQQVDAMGNSAGATQRKFEQMASSSAYRMAQMRQEITRLQRKLGEAMMPGIKKAMDALTAIVSNKAFVGVIEGIGVIIGGILADLVKIIGATGYLMGQGTILQEQAKVIGEYVAGKAFDLTAKILTLGRGLITTLLHLAVGAFSIITGITPKFELIAKRISDFINNSINFYSAKAGELTQRALRGGEDFLNDMEGKLGDALRRGKGAIKGAAKDIASNLTGKAEELRKKLAAGFTTTPSAFRIGPEGRKTTPEHLRMRKMMGLPVEEMIMGQLRAPAMLGPFGLRYGGLMSGRLARFIRKFGPEEGMKKFQEKMSREAAISPQVGFMRDITPAGRARARAAAYRRAKPMEWGQKVAQQVNELQDEWVRATLSGAPKRAQAISQRISQLRKLGAPEMKEQLGQLKLLQKRMKNMGKEMPAALQKRMKEMQKALGENVDPIKKKTDELTEKVKRGVKKMKEESEKFMKSKVVKPIIDAMKNNKAEATAAVSVNCQGDCSVEKYTSTAPNQRQVPSSFSEPVSDGVAPGAPPM